MTEQKDPRIAEEMYQHELRQKRAAWEQERRERKGQQEREQKQAELQGYLARRSRDFLDHAGEEPTREDLARWRAEYLDELEAEEQRKRKAAIAEYDRDMGF
jgi:hypothetical protein